MSQIEMQQQTIQSVDDMRRCEREAYTRILAELVEIAKTNYLVYQCRARGCSFDAAMNETYEEIKRFGESLGHAAAEVFLRAQMNDPIFVGLES